MTKTGGYTKFFGLSYEDAKPMHRLEMISKLNGATGSHSCARKIAVQMVCELHFRIRNQKWFNADATN